MRALLAPVLLLLTTTGAALAAPVPVLALRSDAALVTRNLAREVARGTLQFIRKRRFR